MFFIFSKASKTIVFAFSTSFTSFTFFIINYSPITVTTSRLGPP